MASTMDWFEQLAGFQERDYTATQARFDFWEVHCAPKKISRPMQ